ncbi:DUF5712 family protein [Mucilaginibacter gotjawali]|uniref:Uncharacterized protein n=2 Tax=Mucilaginibacter gotjawali TaxID=1550579 RepID=A0A110B337_9SPHI|nr:hypothetical protein [Mucilaginibacter gotjawali]BAU54923.1 hypothetical protein MgSA37_03102 [Mucilaginibacter gotjawali]
MGQFARVALKQSGETLFDSLFEFHRQLKDSIAYASTQKNGNLAQRLDLNIRELQMVDPNVDNIQTTELDGNSADAAHSYLSYPQISISMSDDIDDEAIFGKNRHGKRKAGGHER